MRGGQGVAPLAFRESEMADFDSAFGYLMRWEDVERDGHPTGAETKDAGGRTRLGIAERWHPELTAAGFYDVMPLEEALTLAEACYRAGEWSQCQGASLQSQVLGNKLLSLGVNLGMETVIRWAQQWLGAAVDGIVGPATLKLMNIFPTTAMHGITDAAVAHLQARDADETAAGRTYPIDGLLRRARDAGF